MGVRRLGALAVLAAAGVVPATASANFIVANAGNQSITFYAGVPGATANQPPTRTIAGPATGLHGPTGIAQPRTGLLYVANRDGNSVTVYAGSAANNAAPLRTIAGPATGLAAPKGVAVNANGRTWVANSATSTITIYAAGANGNVAPVARIAGANTGLAQPQAIALDDSGRLFVVNALTPSVTEYAAGATGNVKPIHTLAGANTGLSEPTSIALSSFDDFLVGNGGQSNLTVYFAGTWNNSPPDGSLGQPNGLITPGGIGFEDGSHLIVTGVDSDNVLRVGTGNVVLGTTFGAMTGLNQPTGLIVKEPLTLDPPLAQTPQLTVGTPYQEHSLAWGGVHPYTWSVASGTLPTGVTLDPRTGLISGTPTTNAGGPVTIRVTDSAPTPASATNSRIYFVNPAIQPAAYVANGGNTAINAFALTSSGNVPPWTTFTSANGLNAADAMAFDARGHLLAANYGGGDITEYPAGPALPPISTQGGVVTPAGITIAGSTVFVTQQAANTVSAFAFDPVRGLLGPHQYDIAGPHTGMSAPAGVVFSGGLVYVANEGNDSVTTYLPTPGDQPPVTTLAGFATGLHGPKGLALDDNGDLLVANSSGASVSTFSINAAGNSPPLRSIAGSATGLSGPSGVDIDSQGRVFVADALANLVNVYPAGADGNVAPVATYAGTNTGLKAPEAVAVTPPMSILTRRLPRGRVHHRYRARLRAAEGTTPYRWSIARGRLPRGLHLSRRGRIHGRPRHAGRRHLTVRVRDASHPHITLQRRLAIRIRPRHHHHHHG